MPTVVHSAALRPSMAYLLNIHASSWRVHGASTSSTGGSCRRGLATPVADPGSVTAATRQIFGALDTDGSGTLRSAFFLDFLARNGLSVSAAGGRAWVGLGELGPGVVAATMVHRPWCCTSI